MGPLIRSWPRTCPHLALRRRTLPATAFPSRRLAPLQDEVFKLFSAQRRPSSAKSSPQNVLDVLEHRGLLSKITSRALRKHLDPSASPQRTAYLGIDPSAPSLHVGNLLAIIGLLHFVLQGHRVIALVGGATGSIGDPSGRSTERPALDETTLDTNIAGIRTQLLRLLDNGLKYGRDRLSGKAVDASMSERFNARGRSSDAGLGHDTSESVEGLATGAGQSEQESGRTLRGGPSAGSVKVLDNRMWLGDVGLLEFLRTVGKHARVSTMLSRESVSSRLSSESGISFTEFAYQLLQAYDFATLHATEGCTVQIGGSDQEGNIMGGIELVRKMKNLASRSTATESTGGEEAVTDGGEEGQDEMEGLYGLMMPLLTTSDGTKFGKSAGNAIWLDAGKTPPVDLYQSFVRTGDQDVERYLRALTFVPLTEIESTMVEHQNAPHLRKAQQLLASEITRLVHGDGGLSQALLATTILFTPQLLSSLPAASILAAFEGSPHLVRVPRAEISSLNAVELLVRSGLCSSRGDARKATAGKAVTVNHRPVTEEGTLATAALERRVLVLKRGKTVHKVVEIID